MTSIYNGGHGDGGEDVASLFPKNQKFKEKGSMPKNLLG